MTDELIRCVICHLTLQPDSSGLCEAHQYDEQKKPEWSRCGQCLQPLYMGHHPYGSKCEHA